MKTVTLYGVIAAALELFGEFACTNQTLGLLDDGYTGEEP